jgi:argininosuccinate lyase
LATVGPLAYKLYIGRGRAESALTALRLYLIEAMGSLSGRIATAQRALILNAEGTVGALLPGYLDGGPAQVISAAAWFLSHFWRLARDQDRLAGALSRASVSPLGSGALGGASVALDRAALAERLGFGTFSANSRDAVTDLDFAAEFLFAVELIGAHLAALAADLGRFSDPARGFFRLEARFTHGGQTAIHQRSDQAIELSAGRASRLLGALVGFLGGLNDGPPTAEQAGALFGAVDTLEALLTTVTGALETLTVHSERMLDALDDRLFADDLADYLTARGAPYREAHAVAQRLLQEAAAEERALSELPLESFQAHSPLFGGDVFALFDFTRSAAARNLPGGTAPAALRAQIRQALDWLVEAGLE